MSHVPLSSLRIRGLIFILLAFGPTVGLILYLIHRIPPDDILTDLHRTRLGLAAGVFLINLLVVGIAWFAGNRLVLGRVRALGETIGRLAAGDLGARIGTRYGSGEFGQLARGFDQMAESLQRREAELRRTEAALQQANERLACWVGELRKHNQEMALLSEMGDLLQACRSAREAFSIIAHSARQLFPTESGALYMRCGTQDLLDQVAAWGNALPCEPSFAPDACWALRRGRAHRVGGLDYGPACGHVASFPPSFHYLCVPIMAQGETLGVLHLRSGPVGSDQPEARREPLSSAKQHLAIDVAEHISLALANLNLRERLRRQAIRDPLTGLFNRRYMQETLKRELHRAERKASSVGVILLDIDHFKQFNDTFGHAAGDALLHHLGTFLQRRTRKEDFACRYGGEEFLLILTEASLDVARERAEELREGIKHLHVQHDGRFLGIVTLSLGVAAFPTHGSTAEDLLQVADEALYVAKEQGRDRVVTGEGRGDLEFQRSRNGKNDGGGD
ncbi:MAG: diguanylate cyclase [Candidatus Tectomicrobia bacterium]|uniref:diguanylate cyclase n=1 Tax=Tectimicrobiota bacterium TaxID=2528274 RepID=A0A932CLX7_UNCTE|nr:diguanylate cyclase [Candidatus Tectomicrobia bacterium]